MLKMERYKTRVGNVFVWWESGWQAHIRHMSGFIDWIYVKCQNYKFAIAECIFIWKSPYDWNLIIAMVEKFLVDFGWMCTALGNLKSLSKYCDIIYTYVGW